MGIVRRTIAVFLFLIAGLFTIIAGVAKSGDGIAGTPTRAVDTALSVISTNEGSSAIAHILVDNLQKDAGADAAPAFAAHKDALIAAVAATFRDPATQTIAHDIALRYVTAKVEHQSTTIDMRPIVFRITGAMHAVDARIPAQPQDMTGLTVTITSDGQTGNPLNGFATGFYIFFGFALAIAFVVARFMVRRRTLQYLSFGLALGIPALLLAAISTQGSTWVNKSSFDNVYARAFVERVVLSVESAFQQTALFFLVVVAITIGVWFAYNRFRASTDAQEVATAPAVATAEITPDSKTPEPLPANQSDSGVSAE